jgi:hypothetical protein
MNSSQNWAGASSSGIEMKNLAGRSRFGLEAVPARRLNATREDIRSDMDIAI